MPTDPCTEAALHARTVILARDGQYIHEPCKEWWPSSFGFSWVDATKVSVHQRCAACNAPIMEGPPR